MSNKALIVCVLFLMLASLLFLLAGCAVKQETFGDLPAEGGGGLLIRKNTQHQP